MRLKLHFDIKHVGVLLITPYVLCFATSIVAGFVADNCIARGFRVTLVRQIMHSFSQLIPAVFVVIMGYMDSPIAVVVALTIAMGISGAGSASFGANHLDVAPQYASITLSIANTVASFSGVVAPIVVGHIINPPRDDIGHWQLAFFLSSVITVVGWAVYVWFVSGRLSKSLIEDNFTAKNITFGKGGIITEGHDCSESEVQALLVNENVNVDNSTCAVDKSTLFAADVSSRNVHRDIHLHSSCEPEILRDLSFDGARARKGSD